MRGSLKRETKETCVEVSLETEGSGICDIGTGIDILDEMLRTIAETSGFDLSVKAIGDLETGDHHTTEDVGITLGIVLGKLVKKGLGSAMVPSGECLALTAVRFGEPGYKGDFDFKAQETGGMMLENFGHFMRALAYNGRFTLHLKAEGEEDGRKIDAMAAALGLALKQAASS